MLREKYTVSGDACYGSHCNTPLLHFTAQQYTPCCRSRPPFLGKDPARHAPPYLYGTDGCVECTTASGEGARDIATYNFTARINFAYARQMLVIILSSPQHGGFNGCPCFARICICTCNCQTGRPVSFCLRRCHVFMATTLGHHSVVQLCRTARLFLHAALFIECYPSRGLVMPDTCVCARLQRLDWACALYCLLKFMIFQPTCVSV